MFKKSTIFTSVVLALSLTACGGGGSSSDTVDDIKESITETITEAITDPVDPNIQEISGVYNTSSDTDETYLHISEAGLITVYDYQGDTDGDAQSCYTLATESTQINSSLHTKEVSYDSATSTYSVIVDDQALTFMFDADNGMNSFKYSFLSSGTAITFSANNINIRLGGTGSLQDANQTVSAITDNLCS